MYAPLANLHTRALRDLERMLGHQKFTFLGFDYPCVPSTLERGTTIDFGGRLVDIKLTLTVRTEAVAGVAKPLEAGKTLTFQGETYRIALAKLSSPGDHLRLLLIDPNR